MVPYNVTSGKTELVHSQVNQTPRQNHFSSRVYIGTQVLGYLNPNKQSVINLNLQNSNNFSFKSNKD